MDPAGLQPAAAPSLPTATWRQPLTCLGAATALRLPLDQRLSALQRPAEAGASDARQRLRSQDMDLRWPGRQPPVLPACPLHRGARTARHARSGLPPGFAGRQGRNLTRSKPAPSVRCAQLPRRLPRPDPGAAPSVRRQSRPPGHRSARSGAVRAWASQRGVAAGGGGCGGAPCTPSHSSSGLVTGACAPTAQREAAYRPVSRASELALCAAGRHALACRPGTSRLAPSPCCKRGTRPPDRGQARPARRQSIARPEGAHRAHPRQGVARLPARLSRRRAAKRQASARRRARQVARLRRARTAPGVNMPARDRCSTATPAMQPRTVGGRRDTLATAPATSSLQAQGERGLRTISGGAAPGAGPSAGAPGGGATAAPGRACGSAAAAGAPRPALSCRPARVRARQAQYARSAGAAPVGGTAGPSRAARRTARSGSEPGARERGYRTRRALRRGRACDTRPWRDSLITLSQQPHCEQPARTGRPRRTAGGRRLLRGRGVVLREQLLALRGRQLPAVGQPIGVQHLADVHQRHRLPRWRRARLRRQNHRVRG